MLRRAAALRRVFRGPPLKRVQAQHPVSTKTFPAKQKPYSSPHRQWRMINTWFADTCEVDANIPTVLDEPRYQQLLLLDDEDSSSANDMLLLLGKPAAGLSEGKTHDDDEEDSKKALALLRPLLAEATQHLVRLCRDYAMMDTDGMVKIVKPQEINTGPSNEMEDMKLKRRRTWFTLRSKIEEFMQLVFRRDNGVQLGDKYELLIWIEAAQHAASWIRQVPYENRPVTEYLPLNTRQEVLRLLQGIREEQLAVLSSPSRSGNGFFLGWSDAGIERLISLHSLAKKYAISDMSRFLQIEQQQQQQQLPEATAAATAKKPKKLKGTRNPTHEATEPAVFDAIEIALDPTGTALRGAEESSALAEMGKTNSETLIECMFTALQSRHDAHSSSSSPSYIRPRLALSISAAVAVSSSRGKRNFSALTFSDAATGEVAQPMVRDAVSYLCFSLASDVFETFDGKDMAAVLDLYRFVKELNIAYFVRCRKEKLLKKHGSDDENANSLKQTTAKSQRNKGKEKEKAFVPAAAPELDIDHLIRVAMRRVRTVMYRLDGKHNDFVYSDYQDDIFVGGDLLKMGMENKAWAPHVIPHWHIHRRFPIGGRKLSLSPAVTTALQAAVQKLSEVESKIQIQLEQEALALRESNRGDAEAITEVLPAARQPQSEVVTFGSKHAADARKLGEDVVDHVLSMFRSGKAEHLSLSEVLGALRTLHNVCQSAPRSGALATVAFPSAEQLFYYIDRTIAARSHAVCSLSELAGILELLAQMVPHFGNPRSSIDRLEMCALRLVGGNSGGVDDAACDIIKIACGLSCCGCTSLFVIDHCAAAALKDLEAATEGAQQQQGHEDELVAACWLFFAKATAVSPLLSSNSRADAISDVNLGDTDGGRPGISALFDSAPSLIALLEKLVAMQSTTDKKKRKENGASPDVLGVCWWYVQSSVAWLQHQLLAHLQVSPLTISSPLSPNTSNSEAHGRAKSLLDAVTQLITSVYLSSPLMASNGDANGIAAFAGVTETAAAVISVLILAAEHNSRVPQQGGRSALGAEQTKVMRAWGTRVLEAFKAFINKNRMHQQQQLECSLNFRQIVLVAESLRHVRLGAVVAAQSGTTAATTTPSRREKGNKRNDKKREGDELTTQLLRVCSAFDTSAAGHFAILANELANKTDAVESELDFEEVQALALRVLAAEARLSAAVGHGERSADVRRKKAALSNMAPTDVLKRAATRFLVVFAAQKYNSSSSGDAGLKDEEQQRAFTSLQQLATASDIERILSVCGMSEYAQECLEEHLQQQRKKQQRL